MEIRNSWMAFLLGLWVQRSTIVSSIFPWFTCFGWQWRHWRLNLQIRKGWHWHPPFHYYLNILYSLKKVFHYVRAYWKNGSFPSPTRLFGALKKRSIINPRGFLRYRRSTTSKAPCQFVIQLAGNKNQRIKMEASLNQTKTQYKSNQAQKKDIYSPSFISTGNISLSTSNINPPTITRPLILSTSFPVNTYEK